MTCLKNILVLIVDDEPLIRELAFVSLEEAGFDVLEAATADQALKVLKTHADVGLLFTDIQMPGALDGLDLADLVHRLWPSIKLVVTSGKALQRPIPDDGRFLGKPYNLKAMTDLIAETADPDAGEDQNVVGQSG